MTCFRYEDAMFSIKFSHASVSWFKAALKFEYVQLLLVCYFYLGMVAEMLLY